MYEDSEASRTRILVEGKREVDVERRKGSSDMSAVDEMHGPAGPPTSFAVAVIDVQTSSLSFPPT